MASESVEVIARTTAEPDAVWAIAGDFCGAWHPFIAHMQAQHDESGVLVRAFSVHGESTLYKEQLIYYSDSDRQFNYKHLQGIEGVESYCGALKIAHGQDGGSTITLSADLSAPPARAQEIAAGTQAIFQAGVDALIAQVEKKMAANQSAVATKTQILEGKPSIALSVTPARDEPPCIFLHGIGGNRSNWDGQLSAFSSNTQCVAMDLRGYGQSELGDEQSTVDDYCNDILRTREALGADKIVLCGLSYGSWLAVSFAMRHPALLAGLVLSGGCTGMSQASEEEREAFRNSREAPLNAGQTPADFADNVVKAISGPHASTEASQALHASMSAITSDTYRDALNCFVNPLEQLDFSKLNMPVLMVTGEHDRLAPPDEIGAVAQKISNSAPNADVRFEVIRGAGHVCNLEEPQRYNYFLKQFLDRVCV